MDKRQQIEGCDLSELDCVSLSLCHHDRPAAEGNPEQLGPHCSTHTGLHTLTDRAKGCPVHATSLCACLSDSNRPPSCFHHLSVLRKQLDIEVLI